MASEAHRRRRRAWRAKRRRLLAMKLATIHFAREWVRWGLFGPGSTVLVMRGLQAIRAPQFVPRSPETNGNLLQWARKEFRRAAS